MYVRIIEAGTLKQTKHMQGQYIRNAQSSFSKKRNNQFNRKVFNLDLKENISSILNMKCFITFSGKLYYIYG